METAHKNSWVLRRCIVHTCNNIPISVLHAVLILLGRVPRCRLSFKKALERQKTQNREGADEFYCHMWALKMRTRLKNTGIRTVAIEGETEWDIFTSLLDMKQRGWGILGSWFKQRAPLGQRWRVSRSNLSPCAALPGGATAAAVCLPHLKDSISPSRVKNKACSSSADQKTAPLRLPSWNIYHLSLGRFPFWWHTRHN